MREQECGQTEVERDTFPKNTEGRRCPTYSRIVGSGKGEERPGWTEEIVNSVRVSGDGSVLVYSGCKERNPVR